jgi:hypothetical protein
MGRRAWLAAVLVLLVARQGETVVAEDDTGGWCARASMVRLE